MVGRMVPIKNPLLLVDAFITLLQSKAPGTQHMRLAMVGEGPLMVDINQRMQSAGLQNHLWLPGGRADIAAILRATNCFVLPSLSEGTSCTLQEAMATGLPIVATQVGGNADLLEGGRCGSLVPSGNVNALAAAVMQHYTAGQPSAPGNAAKQSVQQRYGLPIIINRYRHLFLKHTGHVQ
jgi:glycosyltransferase involved in cell wall biosynthesis